MRIVNRQTFLAMSPGTIFAKYRPCVFEELLIKGETLRSGNDFLYQPLVGAIDAHSSEVFEDKLHAAELAGADGPEVAMDFDVESRDGLYDADQLFAVWSREDVEGLIERLRRATEENP